MTTNGGTPTSFFGWRSFCRRLRSWGRVGTDLVSVLYPPECVLCGRSLPALSFVCERCASGLPELVGHRCRRCGEAIDDPLVDLCLSCGTRVREFDRIVALGPYEDGWSDLVRALKFDRERAIGRWMSVRLADLARREGLDDTVDVVSFVPMTPSERRARGFNQADVLARGVARRLGLPVRRILIKTRRTPPQRELPATARRENLRDAYRLLRSGTQRVLLVDDVCTTGSTVDECARTLKRGGYSSVVVLTVARA
jgi:ComF family protein